MSKFKYLAWTGVILGFFALVSWFLYPLWDQEVADSQEDAPIEQVQEQPFLSLSDEQKENAGFELRLASSGKLKMTVLAPGKIIHNPDHYVSVIPKIAGSVKEARKSAGDSVKEGEILAILESPELMEIKGAFLTSLRKEAQVKTTYEREKRLRAKQIGTGSEFLEAEANYEAARAERVMAKQRLKALGISDEEINAISQNSSSDFGYKEIRAPFDGTVIRSNVSNGQSIDASHEAFVVVDLTKLWVELGIYPKDFEGVAEGQKVVIVDNRQWENEATIIKVNPTLDSETARIKAIALLENPSGQWQVGSYVFGNIKMPEENVPILVPKDALMRIDNEDCLFIEHPNGFEKRNVLCGRHDDKNVEVLIGVNPGERYVSKNAFLLKFELTKGEPD